MIEDRFRLAIIVLQIMCTATGDAIKRDRRRHFLQKN
jgi:hypothetical protein